MKAKDIVERIGTGVHDALKTNEFFLGIDAAARENTDIHPEYVITVKVGEALISPNHIVSLEAHMKLLRVQARKMARMKSFRKRKEWSKIDLALSPYVFGERDSERLDVLVLDSDRDYSPILMAEAKLGVRNLPGVVRDIDRIIKLLDMFEAVGVLSEFTYGAVVFHLMEEDSYDDKGDVIPATTQRADLLLEGIEKHLAACRLTRPWLHAKAGLLKSLEKIEPASGYVEVHDDETTEEVFEKHGFRFAPGLVLLGSAKDVNTVSF